MFLNFGNLTYNPHNNGIMYVDRDLDASRNILLLSGEFFLLVIGHLTPHLSHLSTNFPKR